MGFWDVLKGIGKVGLDIGTSLVPGGSLAKNAIKAGLGAGSAALGAAGQGMAQNRGAQFGGQMDLERLLMDRDQQFQQQQIAREQEGRASGSDAWRKLLAAQRVTSPGARPQLSPYSIAPRQATGAELQGADAMTAEVMARLQGGNPIAAPTQRPMQIDPKLLKPGAWEKVFGIASPVAGIAGAMLGAKDDPMKKYAGQGYATGY